MVSPCHCFQSTGWCLMDKSLFSFKEYCASASFDDLKEQEKYAKLLIKDLNPNNVVRIMAFKELSIIQKEIKKRED